MTTEISLEAPPPSAAPKLASLRVFGIGHAGVRVLEETLSGETLPAAFAALDSDPASLAGADGISEKYLCSATGLAPFTGLGSEDRLDSAAKAPRTCAPEDLLPRLKTLCEGAQTVVIVAGLGGLTGTALTPLLARAARDSGALTLAFVILPFQCEGSWRLAAAQAGLEQIREQADLVIALPNQKTLPLTDASTTLLDTYRASARIVATSLRANCLAFAGRTVMGSPFPTLVSFIRRRSADCAFAMASASGSERAGEALERLLVHPMLGGAETFAKAEAVGVFILAGSSLTMAEVNRVMEKVQELCQRVPVMLNVTLLTENTADSLIAGAVVARAEEDRGAAALAASTERIESVETQTPAPSAGASPVAHPAGEPQPDAAVRLDSGFLDPFSAIRPASRFVAPPPDLSPEKLEQLRARQGLAARSRKALPKLRQSQLPLEIVSKGRFEKSEPTVHKGEDLDVPTYIRRGVTLN